MEHDALHIVPARLGNGFEIHPVTEIDYDDCSACIGSSHDFINLKLKSGKLTFWLQQDTLVFVYGQKKEVFINHLILLLM